MKRSSEKTEKLPPSVAALFAEDVTANSAAAYRKDIEHFVEWCRFHGRRTLPCTSTTLVEFLIEHSEGYSLATVERRAAAVSWMHRKAGYLGEQNPREAAEVTEAIRLLRRRHRDKKPKQAKELTTAVVREIMANCKADGNPMKGLRDRAMILLGFAGAFRRSELVQLTVADLEFVIQGVEVTLPWSKTDQTGIGQTKRIARGQVPATCPVSALMDWLRSAAITSGPLFRKISRAGNVGPDALTEQSFCRIVKNRAKEAGLQNWQEFSAHSVRSGFASTAAENGASLQAIKGQGGWKSDGVALRYIRNREDWQTSASYRLGL